MATVKQYALQLWGAHKTIAQKLGMDVTTANTSTRVSALSEDVMLGTLIKVLVDKGLITNQDLTTAYNAVIAAQFPPLPSEVVVTSDSPPAPDPDLGV